MRPTAASTLRGGVYVVESARPGAMTTATNDGGDDGHRTGVFWRDQVLAGDECAHGEHWSLGGGATRVSYSRIFVAAGVATLPRSNFQSPEIKEKVCCVYAELGAAALRRV